MRIKIALVSLLLLLSCSPREATDDAQKETATVENQTQKTKRVNHGLRNVPPERMGRSQTSAHYRVSYKPSADPMPLNDHFRLVLNIQDLATSSSPAKALDVQVDADMPEHNHGMHVKPEVKSLGKGQYEVKGLLFHMAGYWELSVTLSSAELKPETLLFGIDIAARPTQTK